MEGLELLWEGLSLKVKEGKKLPVCKQASLVPFLQNDSDFFLSSPWQLMVDEVDCKMGGQLSRLQIATRCLVQMFVLWVGELL